MRYVAATVLVLGIVTSFGTLVWGNPALLPKHPGYPMGKATDPVNGMPLANDPGQTNATGEQAIQAAAAVDDAHTRQQLSINEQNQRVLEKPGAGLLPKVQGPEIKIEPPVKEATKVEAAPK